MKPHPSHEFSPASWCCVRCCISARHADAAFPCRPVTVDYPCDVEPAEREVDYSKITEGLAS